MTDKIPLDERLDTLIQQIIRTRIYYDLWWFYVGELTRPRIVGALNDFPEFFRFDIHAHFVSMIVHGAVVWDTKNGTISLPNLAREILDPKRCPGHVRVNEELEAQKLKAAGILKIRRGAIAHRSAFEDYATVFQSAGVAPAKLPEMISAWLRIANKLRQIHDPALLEAEFHQLPLHALSGMIHALGGPDLREATSLDDLFKT